MSSVFIHLQLPWQQGLICVQSEQLIQPIKTEFYDIGTDLFGLYSASLLAFTHFCKKMEFDLFIKASRSKIFEQMLECEAKPDQTVAFSEMDTKEAFAFIIYVVHKYEISYLPECCERYILDFLNVTNALDALELSDAFSSQRIMDAIIKFIARKLWII